MRSRLVPVAAGIVMACAAPAAPQTSPFLPDPVFRELRNEISGDRAFEDMRQLTHWRRTVGSRDYYAANEWIRSAATAAGLEDVKILKLKWDGHAWSCASGEAWLVEPESVKLASDAAVGGSIADNSRTTHAAGELVDVGAGVAEADYQGKDVKGKVVLASGQPGRVQTEAVWKRGALGVVSYATSRHESMDAPDQIAWGRLPYEAKDVAGVKDGTPSTFAVMISPRRGRSLQKRAESKPLKVKIDIEASFAEPAEQWIVEGWIHGSEVHDQQIVLTAHTQEGLTSANDDASGCSSLLEIARSLSRLVREGRVARPRRDVRFWWTNEIEAEAQFFRDNPKEPRRMLLDLQQDMVAARQSWGGRVQYASRQPWSIPNALDDVMESVLGLVRDGNTELLTMRGTALPQPFTREIASVKGTREPFHARMLPYYQNSDHQAFVKSSVGVPASGLINWPDEWIHSSGDDLDNIDPTQLQRNAVVVAGVALYFAGAADDDLPALAAYVAARGRGRIAADLATGIAHVAGAAPAERDGAYREARNLIHHSYQKELAAIASVRRMGTRGHAGDAVAQAASRTERAEESDLAALEQAYGSITGKNPPNPDLTREERDMAAKLFVPATDPAAFADALDKAKHVDGLHRVMEAEVWNFADGKRNALAVYEAVAAEALSAGEWYYGTVRPADVLKALERATEAGAFTLKSAR